MQIQADEDFSTAISGERGRQVFHLNLKNVHPRCGVIQHCNMRGVLKHCNVQGGVQVEQGGEQGVQNVKGVVQHCNVQGVLQQLLCAGWCARCTRL